MITRDKHYLSSNEVIFFLFTCVKDGRQYIGRLFNSLLKQTKVNFVHYIYEDGSDDFIEDLVDEYKIKANKLNTPIKIFYEKNKNNIGLNMSIKHCISKCNLPYFIWIDCDNWVDDFFFEELGKTAKKHPNSIMIRSALTSCKIEHNSFIVDKVFKYNRFCSDRNKFKTFFYKFYSFGFFAVKTEDYFKINPYNVFINDRSYFCDDQIIFLCLLMSNESFSFSKKSAGYALTREDSECHAFLNIEREYVFDCYTRTCQLIDATKIDRLLSIKYMLDSYNMLNRMYYSSKPFQALRLLHERKKFLNTKQLPKSLLYKKYNTPLWFFRILLKSAKHLLVRLFHC